jgi:amino acid transporter
MSDTAGPEHRGSRETGSHDTGLAKGAIGVVESAIMGIAGTAPAYSIAVTTAAIVAAVGTLAVGSILFSGLIMFGMMLAFINLNKMAPDAGASFAWVKQVFGPTWGFFAGWGLIVASVVFMVSATIPAATSTLLILSPDKVESTGWVTFTAAVWLTLITAVVMKGIKGASYAQVTFTVIETVIIFALIIAAFIQYGGNPAHIPSWDWFSPFSFTPATFATGALIAVFFYWGWDVTMNLGEETVDGQPQPAGRGAFWAMINLILFFIIMLIVVLIVLTDAEIEAANTNVLYAIAEKLFPHPWGYLAVLSTILSTIGTIETQILCFTRSMFSMSRAKMLHPHWAKIHPDWQTPWFATLGIWVMGLGLLFMSSYLPTVSKILESSILAIGLQICFYMSLAGLASVWYYRGMLKSDMKGALTHVLWPGLATAFMIFIGVYGALEFDQLTMAVGVGGLLLGFLPLVLGYMRNRKTA